MWEQFTVKNVWARTVLEDAAKVTQLGTDGGLQHESPNKEELEAFAAQHRLALRWLTDAQSIPCGEIRRLGKVLGKWQTQRRTSVKVRECYNEADRALRSRYCRKARTSSGGPSSQSKDMEGSHGLRCARMVTDTRWKSTSGKKQCNWWCVACGGQCNWKNPNRILALQNSTDRRSSARGDTRNLCDNLINAFKLVVNRQKAGDSPVNMVVQAF